MITNDPREIILSEAFRLNDIKFYQLILLSIIFIFIVIVASTLSLRSSGNLRICLPTECPHYDFSKGDHVCCSEQVEKVR